MGDIGPGLVGQALKLSSPIFRNALWVFEITFVEFFDEGGVTA
jgi:hypothetical protein